MKLPFLSFLFCALMAGCVAHKAPGRLESNASNRTSTISNSMTLVDLLRKVPGLSVNGEGRSATVYMRGISSFYGNNEPLFIVNGQPLNGGLKAAIEMLPIASIKSVKALKNPGDVGIYGVRGANGVILIQME